MARTKLPATPQDTELSSALKMIESNRTSQVGGIQGLGTAQDSNISSIYNNLRGGLQQGVQDTQAIYSRGGQNIKSAYDMGGAQAGAANAGAMSQIGDNASRLGMDPRALAEVQGKLATQAGMFATRNAQSSAERQATMAQQGTGMTAISQMAVQAAQHAEAQGKKDLSQRILTEVAKANSSAATQKTGATNAAAKQAEAASARAQAQASSAMKSLLSEQRAAARDARANARANKPVDPLDHMLKQARWEQIMGGMDPNSTKNLTGSMKLDALLRAEEERNSETTDNVWADIRGRFPKGGKNTIALLQEALQANTKAGDGSGITGRQLIDKKVKDHNLDKQVEYDQYDRLIRALSARR